MLDRDHGGKGRGSISTHKNVGEGRRSRFISQAKRVLQGLATIRCGGEVVVNLEVVGMEGGGRLSSGS